MDIDQALDLVGGYRRWHLTIFILLGISLFLPLCWQGLIVVFIGWEPNHHCHLANDQDVTESIPSDHGGGRLSKCSMYINSSIGDYNVSDCKNGWTYENQGYFTIVEQWDLVCERNYLSEMSQITYQVGCLFAEIFFAYLIDRFGRKLVHIVSHIAICGLGISVAFANSYLVFSLLRAVLGMLIVANVNSGLTECMELFDSKRRAFAGIGLEFQWIFCYLTLPLLAFYIADWRILQIVVSASSAIWIIYFWILPESPIWLVAAGRYDEAEYLLHQMARWNGVPIDPNRQILQRPPSKSVKDTLASNGKPPAAVINTSAVALEDGFLVGGIHSKPSTPMQSKRSSAAAALQSISMHSLGHEIQTIKNPMTVPVWDLFKDSYMRKYMLLSSLLWFANCIVYYGLILSTPTLAGNRFLNFLIMGFVELPAVMLALYTTERFGRRLSTAVFHVIAGVPLAIVIFIPQKTEGGIDLSPVVITLVMVSKFAISASFSVIILYTKELFPTNLRGTSSGICQILGRIGNIFAPFAVYLSKTSFYWFPNVAFGIISIFVGLLTLLLPETTGWPLPQTIDDVHALTRSSKTTTKKKSKLTSELPKKTNGVAPVNGLKEKYMYISSL